jgi:Fe-S-cluster formation regulator IscX/YfhJ
MRSRPRCNAIQGKTTRSIRPPNQKPGPQPTTDPQEQPMKTLSETLAEERERCRRLMNEYSRIGNAGAFAAALVEQAIAKSEYAARTGQFTTMRQALMDLQRFDDLPPSQQAATAISCANGRRGADRTSERNPGPALASAPGRAPAFAFTPRTAQRSDSRLSAW